ncbi:NAD(P)H-dependent glycerol-3-phosphate dehydrogenase [Butyricicoccus sp.]|uniref:NAD(P)H-dependent glycerol-3-phosphate dehydrogenase n=1 Tax=Butyricicoccus sp. TaxID=2049021 RepID=UPI0037369426
MKIFVVGCGGWGMALSILLHENGHEVTAWSFFEEECRVLREERGNERLLPGIKLPEEIEITNDLTGAAEADIVLMAVPSFAVHSTAQQLSHIIPAQTVIVNVGKGLDRDNDYCRFSETITNATNGKNPVVALTGPTHAEEVARGILTAILAASESRAAATLVQQAFMNDRFRVYISPDIIGAELGGCFKNIIALAAGICDGVGLGDNSKAALMTRGLTEIARLGVELGGRSETFAGLSGMGDLIVTCTSMHSRNRRAGIKIGQGMDVQQAMKEVGAVVEGYYATEAGYMLAQKTGIDMPITSAMYDLLYRGKPVQECIQKLMARPRKSEIEEIWR